MLKPILKAVAIASLALPGIAPAFAQADVALEADVMIVRTVEEDGVIHEALEEPERVLPGDRLVFTTSFANGGSDVVENFVITNPLPAAVVLAENGDFAVSVDAGVNYQALSALTVTQEDGTTRSATLNDVTHLRWTIASLAPGESGDVKYFAFVR